MAAIREVLTLEDRFSATFTKFLNMGGRAATASAQAASATQNYQSVLGGLDKRLITLNAQFEVLLQKQSRMAAAGQQNTAAFAALDSQMEKLGSTIRDLSAQYDLVESQAKEAARAAAQFSENSKKAGSSSDSLVQKLKSVAGAYVGLQGMKKLLDLSDTMSSTTARLDMMNDGLQTTEELNQMIFESAQRARGSYMETANFVAKLGNLAGDAFSSNAEIVAFAEQINKQIVLSGASSTEASSAIYQLTQGLSSGVLRGEELNSVMEQTPMIAKTIADYMGVSTGKMRELAKEGKITADVVKNAMFAAAEETNAKFEEMPMTWSQIWTKFQNIAVQALQPLLDVIGQIPQFIEDNWPVIEPIVVALAAALGVLTVATLAQAAAQWVMNSALWASPITWITLAVIALVGVIYWLVDAINEATGSSISGTGAVAGAFAVAFAFIKNLFMAAVNWVVAVIAMIWNPIADLANFVGNVFTDPIGAVVRLFVDMADTVLGVLQAIASGIDFIFGTNLSGTIQGWRDDMNAWTEENFGSGTEFAHHIDAGGPFDPSNRSAYTDAWNTGYNWGSNLFSSFGNPLNTNDSQLQYTNNALKDINKSTSATEEDIKSLVDVAERRYVNNINMTAQTPIITVNGANTGRTAVDRQDLANTIRDILVEQRASGSVRTTASAF